MSELRRVRGVGTPAAMGARMLILRLVGPALLASLPLSCAHAPSPPRAAPRVAAADSDAYVIITPEVTLSAGAREADPTRAPRAPDADIMADILAVPPGG